VVLVGNKIFFFSSCSMDAAVAVASSSRRQGWGVFGNVFEATGYREATLSLAYDRYGRINNINEAEFLQALAFIHMGPT
jgi:hypothetical protein